MMYSNEYRKYPNSLWVRNKTDEYDYVRKQFGNLPYVLHATGDYFIIDIDCVDYSDKVKEWLRLYPYYKSVSKEYGRHILVKNVGPFKPNGQKYNFTEKYGSQIELLSGLCSFATADNFVFNADKPMEISLHEDMFKLKL